MNRALGFKNSFSSQIVPKGALQKLGSHIQKPQQQEKRVSLKPQASGDAVSGEWAVNWSLSSYDDVSEFYSDQILNEEIEPDYLLADVMKKDVIALHPDDKIADIKGVFNNFTGAPVINQEGKLVGVVSKKDFQKPGNIVGEIMTKKVIAMRPTAKVIDAAGLMLKHKVHRLPVVDNDKKVLGIVTRTDVFESLPNTEGEVDLTT